MTFFKLLTSALLPGTLFILLAILGVVLFLLKKQCGKKIFIFSVAALFLFSLTPTSDLLLYPLEKNYKQVEDIDEANKIVLLLGGREANVLRGSEVLRISHLSGHNKEIIISGTDPILESSTEALAVKNFFMNRGIPEEIITIEGESRNTKENVENVSKIVGEEPFFLVTSAYHMTRSVREFERHNAEPIPSAADFKRKRMSYGVLDFMPHSQSIRNADRAVHEYLGMAYYRFISLFGS